MSDVVTLPSGLSGVLTGLKGKSMRLLGDKQAVRSGVFIDKILSQCWQETIDNGPYEFKDKPDWSKVLVGDRMYAAIQVRIKSFGAAMSFKQQCTERRCRSRFEHSLDLNDLTVRTLSEEDKVAFANGNRLIGQLPDGRSFVFRLNIGVDEIRAIKQGGSIDPLGVMKARIYEIEGIDQKDPRAMNMFFEEEELSVAWEALAEMDRHDCGVETKVAIECPDCREEMDIEIPFGQGFFVPASKTNT